MYNILVTRKLPGNALDRLSTQYNVTVNPEDRNMTREELLEAVQGKDALISMLSDQVDAELMDAGAGLKVIANYAVGFNNIDVQAATERKIPVCNTPDVLTNASVDFAWTLLMAAARRLIEGDAMTRAGQFTGWGPELLLGVEVFGKTLGIVGAGRIGQAVAKRALGFDMRTLYYNRSRLPHSVEQELKMEYADLETLLKESDFVSLHCPLTPETRYLIDAEELELMKPTAILINTARGPVVNETALVHALRDKVIWGRGP